MKNSPWGRSTFAQQYIFATQKYIAGASNGFDGVREAGEASRMAMRQMAKLKLNAEDNLAYAAQLQQSDLEHSHFRTQASTM